MSYSPGLMWNRCWMEDEEAKVGGGAPSSSLSLNAQVCLVPPASHHRQLHTVISTSSLGVRLLKTHEP